MRAFDPTLYPQGSFRLGTPIRPIGHFDEFDVDLVCRLDLTKEQTSQKELKDLVGRRLKADRESKGTIEERRRCWTLNYRGKYHLDVLPTIPDADSAGTGLLITDTDLVRWQFSNPIGYSQWFYDRMKQVLLEARQQLAKNANAAVEDIPEWRVRTPLQRSVQYLKRHRDIRFGNSLELRPVSIIITTLAGRAYLNEPDLATALRRVVEGMPNFIEKRDGKWWVANPAHPGENFADKWNERPSLREAFMGWLDALRNDVNALANAASSIDARRLVESQLKTGSLARSAPAVSAAPEVDDLSHLVRVPWPQTLSYSCAVTPDVHRDKKGPRIGRMLRLIHKRAWISFKATTDAPLPYLVKWQVTNSGVEARKAHQLRGGFEDGEGAWGTVRWETTKYAGTHFVEAFVIKDGKVVAKSGQVPVRIPR